ncbi:DUF2017 family protein [Phytomonospora sp. NPDC050363]|uniref:DUF2017 family protein n=1 Tax=Phytomonospora sp. NPDC050363 TaxID=3155642 RepID=UPI0033D93D1B
MRAFIRDGDTFVATFAPAEADAIRQSVQGIAGLVRTHDTDDPVTARLFPDVYNDSSDDAAEFHRLTDAELTGTKLAQVDVLLDTLPAEGGEVSIDAETAEAWLRAITDVRLALGVRLDISESTDLGREIDDEILADPVSPRAAALGLYELLTYVQESLVVAVAGW